MARRLFRLTGLVRERATGGALPNLRVEAWDRDTKFHDMLGVGVTDGNGRFTINLDETFFGDAAPDRLPDVYFRVLRDDDRVLASTENSVIRNLQDRERDVVLDVDLPAAQEETVTADRVSASQVYASLAWFAASDFRGAFNDGRDRLATLGRLGGDLVRGAVSRASVAPLQAPAIKQRDVVGQDSVTASANLAQQGVAVNEVRLYTPGEGVEVLDLARTPINLKAGERVNLYQDSQGVVRYYTVVRTTAPQDIRAEDVARLDREVKAVREDVTTLASVRASVDEVRVASEARNTELSANVENVRRDLAVLEQMQAEMQVLRRTAVERERQVASLQHELTHLRESVEQLRGVPPTRPPVVADPTQPPVVADPGRPPVVSPPTRPPARPPVVTDPARPPVVTDPARPPVVSPRPPSPSTRKPRRKRRSSE